MLTSAARELCCLAPSPGKTQPRLQHPRGAFNAQRQQRTQASPNPRALRHTPFSPAGAPFCGNDLWATAGGGREMCAQEGSSHLTFSQDHFLSPAYDTYFKVSVLQLRVSASNIVSLHLAISLLCFAIRRLGLSSSPKPCPFPKFPLCLLEPTTPWNGATRVPSPPPSSFSFHSLPAQPSPLGSHVSLLPKS